MRAAGANSLIGIPVSIAFAIAILQNGEPGNELPSGRNRLVLPPFALAPVCVAKPVRAPQIGPAQKVLDARLR